MKSECPCKLLGVGLWWLLIFFCSLTKRNRAANRFGNYVFFEKMPKGCVSLRVIRVSPANVEVYQRVT